VGPRLDGLLRAQMRIAPFVVSTVLSSGAMANHSIKSVGPQ
jgi:hypothetical protein